MAVRLQICFPCADGRCQACTALEPGAEHDRSKACICRHQPTPTGGLLVGGGGASIDVPPAVPTSAPFDLELALGQAREEGRAAGHDQAWLEAEAQATGLKYQLEAVRAELEQLRADNFVLSQLAPPAPDDGEDRAVFVLLELDGNGGVVKVLGVDADVEALRVLADEWDPPLPGSYTEVWPVGADEPVTA